MSLRPTDLILHRASHLLEVAFDDGTRYQLPCEYLRVESPSAEVQGHSPDQRVWLGGKRDVALLHKSLLKHGFNAAALHGDMDQRSRTAALEAFRKGETTINP